MQPYAWGNLDFTRFKIAGNLIVEIDEFQHKRKNYPCECEITRMQQIYYDLGSEYLLFIRYNPDSYKTMQGKQSPEIKREEYLIKTINISLTKKPETNLEVIYLFYDYFITDFEHEFIFTF